MRSILKMSSVVHAFECGAEFDRYFISLCWSANNWTCVRLILIGFVLTMMERKKKKTNNKNSIFSFSFELSILIDKNASIHLYVFSFYFVSIYLVIIFVTMKKKAVFFFSFIASQMRWFAEIDTDPFQIIHENQKEKCFWIIRMPL